MTDFMTSLERELERLEAELSQNTTYKKASQVRDLIALYRSNPLAELLIGMGSLARVLRGDTKREKIKEAVADILRMNGVVHRTKILEILVANKLMGDEKDPMQSLATILSETKDKFVSMGSGNWAIATLPIDKAPNVDASGPHEIPSNEDQTAAVETSGKGDKKDDYI